MPSHRDSVGYGYLGSHGGGGLQGAPTPNIDQLARGADGPPSARSAAAITNTSSWNAASRIG